MGLHHIELIVIGGSAGSIRAVRTIFQHLEAMPVPILMVLHRPAQDPQSNLQSVLQSACRMPIVEPKAGTRPLPQHIYLAPPNRHLVVEPNKTLALSDSPLVHYSRPSIDVLFFSAADVYRQNTLGILLTGANQDGAMGMKLLKDAGGITAVQDPADCMIDTMPRAAMQLATIDQVLTARQIAEWLNENFVGIPE
ncbi:MAG: chemotaxis protein CheB [Cytophagales bacterium]|nr:chemotaxis protein CheB [Bernardetiaceae bacterium]MDW8204357.1 chemotaxis protein CheB [Cytophagales bacterium]